MVQGSQKETGIQKTHCYLPSVNFRCQSFRVHLVSFSFYLRHIFISPQLSEPDSHNEFEVSTDESQVDKPWLVVPLTPMEKENALVTLLDPTAVPDDVMKAVTGGMAESTNHPSDSEDITDKSETIYVSEPEPSIDGGGEELLIITHEIEAIHHNETSELVRDYIPTPLVILELETDTPYISLSTNQIPEKDLTAVDEDNKAPSLHVTPTTEVLLTTTPAGEELSDLRLSAITGQQPTETTTSLQEDEEVNALPEEEEIEMDVFEPYDPNQDVSELEPEDELLNTEGELGVEPDEENVEVSETDIEDKEVDDVSEPEEELVVENQEEEEEYVEESHPVEVSEPDEGTIKFPTEDEVLQSEKDTVKTTEAVKVTPEPETGLDEESSVQAPEQDEASELGGGVDEVSEEEEKVVVDAGSDETVPEVSKPEAVDVEDAVEEEGAALVPVPEYEDVESEVKVVEVLVGEQVTEATAGKQELLKPESAAGEQSHVTELTETGADASEAAEEKQKAVSEPSETVLEVVDLTQEPDKPEIPQPEEEEEVEGTKAEEEVLIVPAQDEEPEDISEPQLPPDVQDEAEMEVESSKPGEDTVDVLPPAEELPRVSEPESNEEIGDVLELNPEEGTVENLEPEPERDITEPPAESIKILHPLDDVENLYHGEETIQVVEDNEFLQPVEPDYHRPLEEDNLAVIQTDIQPFDDWHSEVDHENPIIEDIHIEKNVDRVESDTSAATTTEAAKSDLQSETSSDNAGEQDSVTLQSMKYD